MLDLMSSVFFGEFLSIILAFMLDSQFPAYNEYQVGIFLYVFRFSLIFGFGFGYLDYFLGLHFVSIEFATTDRMRDILD